MKWLMAIPVWSTPRDSLNRFNLVFSRCPYEESPLSSSFSIQFMLSWTASSNRTVRFGFSSALSSSTRRKALARRPSSSSSAEVPRTISSVGSCKSVRQSCRASRLPLYHAGKRSPSGRGGGGAPPPPEEGAAKKKRAPPPPPPPTTNQRGVVVVVVGK